MSIAVLVKQVPSAESRLSLNPVSNTLERTLTDLVLNPADLVAVEAALRVCEGSETQTLCISMGPSGLEQSTKRALAMGIDQSVHITDSGLEGADIWATSTVLAKAILKTGANFVFAGKHTTDGQSGAVAAYVAGLLGWNFVFAKSDLDIDMVLNRKEPAILVIDSQLNTPRLPNFKGIAAARNKPVVTWSLADIGIENIKPKLKIVSQIDVSTEKNLEKLLGNAELIAAQILEKIKAWSEDFNTESNDSQYDSSQYSIFEASDVEQAAKFAAENNFALVTAATSAKDGKITKRIFDDKIEVVIEVDGKCVVTKAEPHSSHGIAIGIGGGVSDAAKIEKIATALSAQVVGTAAALDKGLITSDNLVGESGKKIHQSIYLSFGVSGAYHHMIGLKGVKHLISVNLDPEAEIFQESDFAVVADADEIAAAIVQELGK